MTHDETVDMARQNALDRMAENARELGLDYSVCECDSPHWCKQYSRCNREMLRLPPGKDADCEPQE